MTTKGGRLPQVELDAILAQHRAWAGRAFGNPSGPGAFAISGPMRLDGVDLRKCNFILEDLRGIVLAKADLRRAWLVGARLNNADLRQADLRHADLSEAHLHAADLRGADLRGARLYGAYLDAARLEGANLRGACGLSARKLLRGVVYRSPPSLDAAAIATLPKRLQAAVVAAWLREQA